jgi:spermidine/putrescine ABC transporter ATP-binding subunit
MGEVDIRGLTKRYGAVVAVDGISLHIDDGEFFGLLGPSGSGKTTLMRCIAGFVEPDAGEIEVNSRGMRGVPTHRRDVGMVFQNYALFPHMSVFDNVAFSLSVRHTPRAEIEQRVSAMLNLVQLSGYEKRAPRQLSGGQQQRIALARAIICNPRLLLLDEPLNALDKRLRQQMQIELKQIQRNVGITTVFVTHDQEEALTLCDRIAIFKDGKVAQVGTPSETYERPATVFAAEFLGAANLLRGRSMGREAGGGRVAIDGGGEVWTADALPASGEWVTLVVRPEKLVIAARKPSQDDPARDPNRLFGKVEKHLYLGSSITYVVRTSAGECTVFQQNRGTEAFEPGADVQLSWLPEHSVVLLD